MAMRQVIVTTSLDTHRAVAIPADMHAAIGAFNAADVAPTADQHALD